MTRGTASTDARRASLSLLFAMASACGARAAPSPSAPAGVTPEAPLPPPATSPAPPADEFATPPGLPGPRPSVLLTGRGADHLPGEPGRSPEEVEAVLARRRETFDTCYGLHPDPLPEGHMRMQWVIDVQGNVTGAELDVPASSIVHDRVEACVIDTLRQTRFAKSPGGFQTRVTYTFHFVRPKR